MSTGKKRGKKDNLKPFTLNISLKWGGSKIRSKKYRFFSREPDPDPEQIFEEIDEEIEEKIKEV